MTFGFGSVLYRAGLELLQVLAHFLFSGLVRFLAKPGFEFGFGLFLLGSGSCPSLIVFNQPVFPEITEVLPCTHRSSE